VSKKQMPKDEISKLRREIDADDKEIVKLLNHRASLALKIRELKNQAQLPIYDEKREREIFEKIKLNNQGPLGQKTLEEIYKVVLKSMKNFG
jgi:chorismate mutase